MLQFTVAEGDHALPCSKCSLSTQVQVYLEGGMLRIRTTGIPMTGKPKSVR